MGRTWLGVWASLAAVVAPCVALANPNVNVQVFRPSPHPGDLFNTETSFIPEDGFWSASALFAFGKNPLRFVDATNQDLRPTQEVIQNQLSLDLMGSYALRDWVDIGVALPIFLVNTGEENGFVTPELDAEISAFALGDMRLSGKAPILRMPKEGDGFGVAASLLLGLPTGDGDSFVSDGFTVLPAIIADYRIGPVLIAGNLGYRFRSSERLIFLDVDSELVWRVGARFTAIPEQLDVFGELHGATSDNIFDCLGDDEVGACNATYVEALVAGRYHLPDYGVAVTFGGGSGLTTGYGNTKFKIVAGVTYAPPINRDQDGDGILDDVDQCPTEPEDIDGYDDRDGCPDPDNDGDGVLDTLDRCPNDPEDIDGFQDGDGCPDPDNDGDGVPDRQDNCPFEPEDRDGFQDEDGCPDPDNDGDGIPDTADRCPNEPETRNGFQDDDGCPDETLAKVDKGKIVIADKIFFDTNRATIKPQSFPVLQAVAGILKANPDIARVRIEGHTDDVGSDRKNLKLSDDRAASVRQWLVDAGVDASRLESVGYGESRPAVPGTSKEAREANRRVEFVIVEQ